MDTKFTGEAIPCIRPYFEMDDDGMALIAAALTSGRVTNHGPQVQAFERALAEWLRVPEAVVVSSGSDALLLSLKALPRATGTAILPAYTYVATLNAVVQAGLVPVFCDVEPSTFTMDPRHLAELLAQHGNVQCVLPVNVFGIPPNLAAIHALCQRAGATLVYDNAHGFGSETNGLRIPAQPHVQIFSFHATKTLPAVEGGLIVSPDAEILGRAKRLRNHGLGGAPAETMAGFNSKMDEIRAIIGLNSLRHFPDSLARRRSYGFRLRDVFSRWPGVYSAQLIPDGVNPNFQNLGVCCAPAADTGLARIVELFREWGVSVRSYFDPPLYKLPAFGPEKTLPVTESIWRTLLCVPIHSRMSEGVLERIEVAAREVAQALGGIG